MSFPVKTVSSSMILYHFFIAFLLSVSYIHIIVSLRFFVNTFSFFFQLFS
nr:MAG TPA: hypothetical protein [Caudoviricetes sp.]